MLGPLWLFASLLISSLNDALTKSLGSSRTSISFEQIIFLRFIIGAITLLPLLLKMERQSPPQQRHLPLHFLRGTILSVAMYLWTTGISLAPLATVTTISFSIPIFLVILARIFLHEKVGISTYIRTFIGFTGIVVAIQPGVAITDIIKLFVFISSAILFASLDVINKSLLNRRESTVAMLFYSNFFAAAVTAIPAALSWSSIGTSDFLGATALGIGSNLILYCILKAYSLAPISLLAPLRYLELLISMTIGYLFFGEAISLSMLGGAALIILCAFNLFKQPDPPSSLSTSDPTK